MLTTEVPVVTAGALVTDEELAAEALSADLDPPIAVDAVPIGSLGGPRRGELLPDWYMPAPGVGARRLSQRRRRVAYLVVAAFLLINAAGLCSTYGSVVIA